MKQVTTTYYCDRCGKKMYYPSSYLRRRTIKFIGSTIDYEVCKECMENFREWWRSGRNKEGV